MTQFVLPSLCHSHARFESVAHTPASLRRFLPNTQEPQSQQCLNQHARDRHRLLFGFVSATSYTEATAAGPRHSPGSRSNNILTHDQAAGTPTRVRAETQGGKEVAKREDGLCSASQAAEQGRASLDSMSCVLYCLAIVEHGSTMLTAVTSDKPVTMWAGKRSSPNAVSPLLSSGAVARYMHALW